MLLREQAKMGPTLSVYYKFFVPHGSFDGYVQRILKTLMIIDKMIFV